MDLGLEAKIHTEINDPDFDTNKIINYMRDIYSNGELQNITGTL